MFVIIVLVAFASPSCTRGQGIFWSLH
jgi:hypothetical protein